MKRSPFIVLGIVAFAVLLFAAAFFCANRFYASRAAQPANDLAWLKQEFRLSDAEMMRIEKLHAGYLPKCAEMCAKIAAKKREIESTLTGVTNVTDTARQKLGELASLRAQCQSQMLEHFVEVSHAMPPEQGQRYLAEMKRITLGAHEQVEESMSEPPGLCMDTGDADVRDRADMERLAGGHDAALNDLMERHATPVFHFLCRMLGNEDDANDLAQETFVRVFRARGSFKTSEKFSTWLFTIAANLARNQFRWRSRHQNVSLDAETDTPEQSLGSLLPSDSPAPHEAALAAERAAAVRAAVSRLPEDLREAIVVCEWEERSMAEAAAMLETTPKAIESRLYRARQILRERLKRWL